MKNNSRTHHSSLYIGFAVIFGLSLGRPARAAGQDNAPLPASYVSAMLNSLVDVQTVSAGSGILPGANYRSEGQFVLLILRKPQDESSFTLDFQQAGSTAAPAIFVDLGGSSAVQASGLTALIDGHAGEMHLKSATTGKVFGDIVLAGN